MKTNAIRHFTLATLLAAMALPVSAAVLPPGTQLHTTQTLNHPPSSPVPAYTITTNISSSLSLIH